MYNTDLIQVDVSGVSLSSAIQGGGYAVILKEVEGDRRLPIIVGHSEAQAIAFELEGVKAPRPLTHDLLKNIILNFGYDLNKVVIDELKDSTFYAKISLTDSATENIDARPSDAIALALKFRAPIYVTDNIMQEVGFIPTSENSITEADENIEQVKESEESPTNFKIKKLKSELDEAVQNEDYEKAAFLRDEINKIDPSILN